MSNVDTVRAHYDASARGDLAGMLAPFADEIAWTEAEGFPTAGTYHGPEAVRINVFERLGADWDGFRVEIDELLDAGDRVIGLGRYRGTSRATGRALSARVAHVFRLRDGKIVAFEQFADTALVRDALAADDAA